MSKAYQLYDKTVRLLQKKFRTMTDLEVLEFMKYLAKYFCKDYMKLSKHALKLELLMETGSKKLGFWKSLFDLLAMGTPTKIAKQIAQEPEVKAAALRLKKASELLELFWEKNKQKMIDAGWLD